MKTLLRWLILPTLVVGIAATLRAQETGETRKTGKVLLLKSGQVMEGEIEQVGNEMCIRRGSSELRIATDRTVRLCPDWIDAYAFMLAHIRDTNADDHLKLARWCHANRMADQAIHHTKAALELQPNHGEAKQLLTALERMGQPQADRPAVAPIATPPVPAVRPVEAPAAVDVTAESFIAFATKVQPILMNACASCHASEKVTAFRLERVADSNRKVSTLRNLAMVIEHTDLDHPTVSPFLVKAVTPHGKDAITPLKDRSAAPFQALQGWVVDTIKKNPQLKEYRAAKNPAPIKKQPEEKPSTFSSQGSSLDVSRPLTPATPPRVARVRDWCDPDIFNEWAHPPSSSPQVAQTAAR
jgi:hypothetical protein